MERFLDDPQGLKLFLQRAAAIEEPFENCEPLRRMRANSVYP